MKYKTLCRLLVRLMGVYFLGFGVLRVFAVIVELIMMLTNSRRGSMTGLSWLYWAFDPIGYLVVGGYLFLGSKWVVDKLIPSNRPYCHECGYDLTGTVGNVCGECGTAFKPIVTDVEPHH
jgi:hypothetical protein